MISLLCAAVSGVLFFCSAGIGDAWPLAWFAGIPLLWLAYGRAPNWQVFLASFAAFGCGLSNLLEAYSIMLPAIGIMIALFAAAFACAVLFARFVQRRTGAVYAIFAFPAVWTAIEFFYATISPHGSFVSLAYSQVPAPIFIQSASVFGLWSVTFAICLFASATALVLRAGKRAGAAAIVAMALLTADLGFGVYQLSRPAAPSVNVAAVADDGLGFGGDRAAASRVVQTFANAIARLAQRGATTVVLPEKIGLLKPQWKNETAPLSRAARQTGTRIVAGFEEHADQNRNVALTFEPDGSTERYAKRHLIPRFELLVPGNKPGLLGNGDAVAICKDMDFQRTIRGDATGHIRMMFVPAWDFTVDGQAHADMAIMRGVEDGFATVRAARDGMLTVADAQGRIVAEVPSRGDGVVALDATVSPGPGATPYVRIGDLFPWLCALVVLALASACLFRISHARNQLVQGFPETQ